MLKKYLEVGQIVGTHGVHGEMRVQAWCNSPEFLKQFKKLYFDPQGEHSVEVSSCRPHGNVVLLKLKGVETLEEAAVMRNRILFIKRKDAKLEKGDYFVQDLIGCSVVDIDTGRLYGTISDVSQTGANDVWHIMNQERKEYLIPAIPDVVISTNVENGVIKIRPLRGIFEDED